MDFDIRKKLATVPRWMWAAAGLLGLAVVAAARDRGDKGGGILRPPVQPFRIRTDSLGDGRYGASRNGHTHKGLDLVTTAGQPVYAPAAGTVTRHFFAYSDSQRWQGVEIQTPTGWRIKVMYITPGVPAGRQVAVGDYIGDAQPIKERYGAAMLNHIHFEVWRPDGQVTDPTPLFSSLSS